MHQNQLHNLIKTIAVKSAELVECIQWSDTDCERETARNVALEMQDLLNRLLEEIQ